MIVGLTIFFSLKSFSLFASLFSMYFFELSFLASFSYLYPPLSLMFLFFFMISSEALPFSQKYIGWQRYEFCQMFCHLNTAINCFCGLPESERIRYKLCFWEDHGFTKKNSINLMPLHSRFEAQLWSQASWYISNSSKTAHVGFWVAHQLQLVQDWILNFYVLNQFFHFVPLVNGTSVWFGFIS